MRKFLYLRINIVFGLIFAFLLNTFGPVPVYAQIDPMPFMPKPGTMVSLSPEFTPAYLKGIVIHPENALKFDFIIYKGDKPLSDSQKKEEYTKLTKYFLASLAIPDDDQWVNLSPYEKDRIIKDNFGKTEMGRDLLAQDYLLKQITASLIYPEDNLGKKFWDRVYTQAQKQYGTTNIPVNTFNKVWILPDDALIYEKGNTAYVIKNHLRVMLEEDYVALSNHQGQPGDMALAVSPSRLPSKEGLNVKAPQGNNPNALPATHSLASQIVREIVLPELQREVNEDQNFAPLRQVYSGMLLATWFKRTLKQSLLGQIYANKAKVRGVDQDPKTNAEIYRQYLQAYKKGVFNFIKEDTDKLSNETIPRKYFSGGTADYAMALKELGKEPIEITRDATLGSRVMGEEAGRDDVAMVAMKEAEHNIAMPDVAMTANEAIVNITAGVTRIRREYEKERQQSTVSPPMITMTYNHKLILNIPVDEFSTSALEGAFQQENLNDEREVRLTKQGNSFLITDAAMFTMSLPTFLKSAQKNVGKFVSIHRWHRDAVWGIFKRPGLGERRFREVRLELPDKKDIDVVSMDPDSTEVSVYNNYKEAKAGGMPLEWPHFEAGVPTKKEIEGLIKKIEQAEKAVRIVTFKVRQKERDVLITFGVRGVLTESNKEHVRYLFEGVRPFLFRTGGTFVIPFEKITRVETQGNTSQPMELISAATYNAQLTNSVMIGPKAQINDAAMVPRPAAHDQQLDSILGSIPEVKAVEIHGEQVRVTVASVQLPGSTYVQIHTSISASFDNRPVQVSQRDNDRKILTFDVLSEDAFEKEVRDAIAASKAAAGVHISFENAFTSKGNLAARNIRLNNLPKSEKNRNDIFLAMKNVLFNYWRSDLIRVFFEEGNNNIIYSILTGTTTHFSTKFDAAMSPMERRAVIITALGGGFLGGALGIKKFLTRPELDKGGNEYGLFPKLNERQKDDLLPAVEKMKSFFEYPDVAQYEALTLDKFLIAEATGLVENPNQYEDRVVDYILRFSHEHALSDDHNVQLYILGRMLQHNRAYSSMMRSAADIEKSRLKGREFSVILNHMDPIARISAKLYLRGAYSGLPSIYAVLKNPTYVSDGLAPSALEILRKAVEKNQGPDAAMEVKLIPMNYSEVIKNPESVKGDMVRIEIRIVKKYTGKTSKISVGNKYDGHRVVTVVEEKARVETTIIKKEGIFIRGNLHQVVLDTGGEEDEETIDVSKGDIRFFKYNYPFKFVSDAAMTSSAQEILQRVLDVGPYKWVKISDPRPGTIEVQRGLSGGNYSNDGVREAIALLQGRSHKDAYVGNASNEISLNQLTRGLTDHHTNPLAVRAAIEENRFVYMGFGYGYVRGLKRRDITQIALIPRMIQLEKWIKSYLRLVKEINMHFTPGSRGEQFYNEILKVNEKIESKEPDWRDIGSSYRKLTSDPRFFDEKQAIIPFQNSRDNSQISDLGGIDLNSANLHLVIKCDGHGVPLPLSQQDLAQLSNIEGLDPVILSIKPANSLPIFSELSK